MVEIFRVALLELVRMIVWAELVCPIRTFLKFNAAAESDTAGAPPPAPQVGNANEPICELQLNVPFTFWYWLVYQNVQSSLGSTCNAV